MAAYRFDEENRLWVLDPESSFNTDGANPPFDLAKLWGGLSEDKAWMAPQPGGSGGWEWGYYPAGVEGLGKPAMLFVLSTEVSWNFTWYILNQVTLDLGPKNLYPSDLCSYKVETNCWWPGNSGEIDLLQPPWTSTYGVVDGYRRLYATSGNANGRCMSTSMGSTCMAQGFFGNGFEPDTTNSYFLGSTPAIEEGTPPTPYLFAAVVDRTGTFIYRLPVDENLWLDSTGEPGLTRKTAACKLRHRPERRPENPGPPCDDHPAYCALFLPNCQASVWGEEGTSGAKNEGCKVSNNGFCSNWFLDFVDTGQWRWPSDGRPSVVQFAGGPPATMPWNTEMEAWSVDWKGETVYIDGCCIEGRGFCPVLWKEVAATLVEQNIDPEGCFGYPWNSAQPTSFKVPFRTEERIYAFTDRESCPKGVGGPGCLPGPEGDYANGCRRCTLRPDDRSGSMPECPQGYKKYMIAGPDLPTIPGREAP